MAPLYTTRERMEGEYLERLSSDVQQVINQKMEQIIANLDLKILFEIFRRNYTASEIANAALATGLMPGAQGGRAQCQDEETD
jgi:hypothetical protein